MLQLQSHPQILLTRLKIKIKSKIKTYIPHIPVLFSPNFWAAEAGSSAVLITTDSEPFGDLSLQRRQLCDEGLRLISTG